MKRSTKSQTTKLSLDKETIASLQTRTNIQAGMKPITAGASNCASCDYTSYASRC